MEFNREIVVEGLEIWLKALKLTVVAIVGYIVIFGIAIALVISSLSLVPLAVAIMLLSPSAYINWLYARGYNAFRMAFPFEWSFKAAYYITLIGAALTAVAPIVIGAYVLTIEPGFKPPDLTLLRVVGYIVGLFISYIFARADFALAEYLGVSLFKAIGVLTIISAVFSFINTVSAVLGIVNLVLLYMAIKEGLNAVSG